MRHYGFLSNRVKEEQLPRCRTLLGQAEAPEEALALVAAAAGERMQRPLPANVTGAIGAISLDLGLPWQMSKGFALIGRTLGTMAHIREEIETPAAGAIDAAIKGALELE